MWPFSSFRRRKAVARNSGARRILLLWWGSFAQGGGTIGDYYSVRNLADSLKARGFACDIMSGAGLDFGEHKVAPYLGADPADYSAMAFVCGPIVLRSRIKRLLGPYSGLPSAALAVSVIGPRSAILKWFDVIVERDSKDMIRFDLALAAAPADRGKDISAALRPAICLRGKQDEYGKSANLSAAAEQAIVAAAANIAPDYQSIDTVMTRANPVERIERQFRETSVLLTTRLHGALFALLFRVPFVAVDQIRGGAKVSRLLKRMEWPWVFAAGNLEEEALADIGRRLQESGWTEEMEAARAKAVALSREMLAQCTDCLVEIGGGESVATPMAGADAANPPAPRGS